MVSSQFIGSKELSEKQYDRYRSPLAFEELRKQMTPMFAQPVAFLDRDGTLIVDQVYRFDASRIEWQPGALAALQRLNQEGWRIVVVSNQSAVARGFCSELEVQSFHQALASLALSEGAVIHGFEYCPYHPDASVLRYRSANHPDRKPNPGMILRHCPTDLVVRSKCFVVGDKPCDLAAGTAAGIGSYLYTPGSDLSDVIGRAIFSTRAGII